MADKNEQAIDRANDLAEEDAIRKSKFYSDSTKMAMFSISAIFRLDSTFEPDAKTLHQEINKQAEEIIKGDTSGIETTLVSQTKTLDALFNRMAAQASLSQNLDRMRAYMDMALRAQNQCRKTLLALVAVKYPPQHQIVGQQNIALNQQVNNGVSRPMVQSQGGEETLKIKPENELLEKQDGKRLDSKAPSATIKAYSPVEAVEVSRGKNPRRKRAQQNERS